MKTFETSISIVGRGFAGFLKFGKNALVQTNPESMIRLCLANYDDMLHLRNILQMKDKGRLELYARGS